MQHKKEHYVLPVFGMSFSCTSFGIFMASFEYKAENPIYNYAFMVVAAATAFELHCGLKQCNPSYFTNWFILKGCELIASLGSTIPHYNSNIRYIDGIVTDFVIISTFVIILHILLILYVWQRFMSARSFQLAQIKIDPPRHINNETNVTN